MIYFGSYGGNTIPIENRIQNWGKAIVEIVGLKCDLFFYSYEGNTAPFW